MHVIGGWSDWVASLQIISRNLRDVGIDASVKIEPDWPAWVSNSAISGTKPSLIWSNGARRPDTVRILLLALRSIAGRSDRTGRARIRELRAQLQRPGRDRPAPVQGHARPEEAAAGRVQAAGDLPERAAVHPAVHRPALVDLQHEVHQGLRQLEQPVRRSHLLDAAAGADLAPVAVLRRREGDAEGPCAAQHVGQVGHRTDDRVGVHTVRPHPPPTGGSIPPSPRS